MDAHPSDTPEAPVKAVQIRDVPVRVVNELQGRAAAEGMSLTAYLRNQLIELASQPSMAEWIKLATDRDWGVDRETVARTIQEIRDEDAE
ncbi:antitoxin [Solihabitans fulvus]|uniref:antitoxin n=1 Tax=Solihabitans fulvus TaxID=1892852 RepID=UPI0016618E18|nr:antitoxin [Solihabitans fulvus]